MRLCFTILTTVYLSCAIIINQLQENDIISVVQITMDPIVINCKVTDMISIYFPILQISNVIYELRNPNGDKFPLAERKDTAVTYNDSIVVKNIPEIYKPTAYEVINTNIDESNFISNDEVTNYRRNLLEDLEQPNRKVTIGPLSDDDYGNWILSVFFKNTDDDWVEMFQVITVHILEDDVPIIKQKDNDTVMLSFGYPISDIQICQLYSPAVAVDKEYERDPLKMDWCGYIIRNYSSIYNGLWKIIGVGKITYQGRTFLRYSNLIKKQDKYD